jgi:hypothetical protein
LAAGDVRGSAACVPWLLQDVRIRISDKLDPAGFNDTVLEISCAGQKKQKK